MSLVPYALTRPLLFGLDAERAHELTLDAIARLQRTPLPIGGELLDAVDAARFDARAWRQTAARAAAPSRTTDDQ
jgi:hypothetical protein